MPLDLFAGVRVRDYDAAKSWYERLLGKEPAFFPHATEAVWELAEHRYLFIVEDGDAPGGATMTRELLKRFASVIAVEPDAEMRTLIDTEAVLAGTAEAIPFVTAASTGSSLGRRCTGSTRLVRSSR